MNQQLTFERNSQTPPFFENRLTSRPTSQINGLLGNKSVQSASWIADHQLPRIRGFKSMSDHPSQSTSLSGRGKLDALKRQYFTPEGKVGRIARALEALNQEVTIPLTLDELKHIIEDPDIEDQF
jgi:hypothetical protein